MKSFSGLMLVFSLLAQFSIYAQSYKSPYDYEIPRRFIGQPVLKDGIYSATVKYYNSTTRKRSTYTLDVEVEDNRVVLIDFGGGRQVHSGQNNSDYDYSGGYLQVLTENRKPESGKTRVTISKGYNDYVYEIFIDDP